MKTRDLLATFNRGRISQRALARIDVSRVRLSAETQTNWMPRTLGSMALRPGLGYKGTIPDDGAYVPFIFNADDYAALELTPGRLRVWDDGDTLVTRASVSTTIANGLFSSDLASWTDADDAGATSQWVTGGYMGLTGTTFTSARRRQSVAVASADQGTAHGLRIVVHRGPVVLRVGTTAGGDELVAQSSLRRGTHSIAFTPNASTFHIELSSSVDYPALVDSVSIEAAGALELPTIWSSAATCKKVRWAQSADIVFCACEGCPPQQIERRANNSWSVCYFEPADGPFLTENTSSLRMTASALRGEITLTASQAYFDSNHVGALFSITSYGQEVTASLSAALSYTDAIRVTGVDKDREFYIGISGTWSGTLTLQRSVGTEGSWTDVTTYTGNTVVAYDDGFDNSVIYYRLGFNAGDYSSGTANVYLTYASGSITGSVRIDTVTSNTVAAGYVVNALGDTDATDIWAEGSWSPKQGYPSAVTIAEGRLMWGGNGRFWASVSDGFFSFDPNYVGDAAPLNKRIGNGPANRVNDMLAMQRVAALTDTGEFALRSSSFEEPLTQTNYNTKDFSSKGSASANAVTVDKRGYFIGRDGKSINEIAYDGSQFDLATIKASLLVPEIGDAGFVRLAAQVEPDARLHCVRADGTVAILVRDPAEDVLCWIDVETDGLIEDVVVLPGLVEDRVFYRVRRFVDGKWFRYHEEWAREDQCVGATINRQADSYVVGAASGSTLTGLSHLEGKTVVVWADGAYKGTFTVSGGQVTLGASVTNWIAGLTYTADFKSSKLATSLQSGPTLTQRSRINKLGLLLADVHEDGLYFGPDFDTLDALPAYEDGAETAADTVWSNYDQDMIEFPGEWDTDNRLCLRATAPKPCTVLAAVINIDRQESA